MKLLYVWIEKFRDIMRQGIVVDDEYSISIESPDIEDAIYLNNQNQKISFSGNAPKTSRKIYNRKLNIQKNGQYKGIRKGPPVESITALVGENASGKTSVMECLHMRAEQFHYRNQEQRYFLLAFLDEANNSIVVRSRDIWLVGEETRKWDLYHRKGYEEYVILLTNKTGQPSIKTGDITHMVSVYQHRRQETEWAYSVMGLPTIPINLDRSNARNAFDGVFDFLCAFPKLGGKDNSLVIFLSDKDSRENTDYFIKEGMTSKEYKSYFIYKLANLLFGKLRDFLYHEKPQFMILGDRIRRPEEDTLKKEDGECAEVLSFCCIDFPQSDSGLQILSMRMDDQPEEPISQAISFFKKSTYVYMDRSGYDRYIDAMERLFDCLYSVKAEFFSALYKLEIPFKAEFRDIVVSFFDCFKSDSNDRNWCESINVDFEWLSAGEYQQAIMFAGLYQRINEKYEGFENRDLIILLDEPEMHMHPETGRQFIDNLGSTLTAFKEKGLIKRSQIIIATHSPFIIQELNSYNHSIALLKKGNGQITICDFINMTQLILPNRTGYSFNLVMYKIFGVPTIELHNELYGVLQEVNKKFSIKSIEAWFMQSKLHIQKTKSWIKEERGVSLPPEQVTLQTYIRNSIHHPENQQNAVYSKSELQKSIDQMIRLL